MDLSDAVKAINAASRSAKDIEVYCGTSTFTTLKAQAEQQEAAEKAYPTYIPSSDLEKLRKELEVYKREAQQEREAREELQEKVRRVCKEFDVLSLDGLSCEAIKMQFRGDALSRIADKVFGTPRETKTASEIAEKVEHRLNAIEKAVKG